MSKLLTVAAVADRFQVSTVTVRNMIRDQRLPAARVGYQWRIPAEAVDEILGGVGVPDDADQVTVSVTVTAESTEAELGAAVDRVWSELRARRAELRAAA